MCARAPAANAFTTLLCQQKRYKGDRTHNAVNDFGGQVDLFFLPAGPPRRFPGASRGGPRRAGCSCTCPARAARALYCKLRDFAGLADKEGFEAETLSDLDLDLVILCFRLLRFVYSSARILRISKGAQRRNRCGDKTTVDGTAACARPRARARARPSETRTRRRRGSHERRRRRGARGRRGGHHGRDSGGAREEEVRVSPCVLSLTLSISISLPFSAQPD